MMESSEQPARFSGSAAAERGALVASTSASASQASPAPVKRFVRQQIPDDILHDEALNAAIAVLPANYNFELHKTVWRLRQANAKRVALQFPEGLLMYACVIADILETFAGLEHTLVMGDVTFGACCIDDYSAAAMGCDFLVHYGHSCLVPVGVTTMPCMYVFVDIAMDVDHLVETVQLNVPRGSKLVLAGTIQFASAIQLAKQQLAAEYPALLIPKAPPLSPGEVLGCTAPVLPTGSADVIVFVADGRFHLEAIMIANPTVPALRYDPYGRILIKESYDQEGMRSARRRAIEAARGAQRWGLVLGTLGRQGNPRTLETLRRHFEAAGLQHTLILLSEVTPTKLQLFSDAVDAWVQVACPRLSIDWGEGFTKPTLNPFEALVALGVVPAWWEPQDEEQEQPAGAAATMQLDFEGSHGAASSGGGVVPPPPGASRVIPKYPMDYYARDGGEWNSSYHKTQPKPNALPAAAEASAAIAAATK